MRYSKRLQREARIRQTRQLIGEALILIGIGALWGILFVHGLFTII